MKRILLVDDNDKYAGLIEEFFTGRGYTLDRAGTAAEGLEQFNAHPSDYYRMIVTDITMETQLAGISMLRKISRLGYPGTVVIASTGFDFPGVIGMTRVLMRPYGVHFLVHKTTILARDFRFYPMALFSAPVKEIHDSPADASPEQA